MHHKYSDKELEYARIYRLTHKSQIQNINAKRKLFRKRQLMIILGSFICVRCGFSDFRALQFDHIDGKGRQDIHLRKHVDLYYKKYIENPELARKTLQVLCSNCNWIKRYENREGVIIPV